MYKFTNGIVVFDEKTRDDFIKAGYKLVATGGIIDNKLLYFSDEDNKSAEKEIKKLVVDKKENFYDYYEVEDENTSNDGTIEEKSRESKKVSK